MRNHETFLMAMACFAQATDEWRASPAGQACWLDVWNNAPDDFKQLAADEAKRMGLLPKPAGYSDDGTPMYRVEDVLAATGTTEADFQRFLAESGIQPEPVGRIHRVH